jgi:pyruvate/2-oxoglutarate dehydrogenase complex dihydrolipoamide dehydrogenase (E3) component
MRSYDLLVLGAGSGNMLLGLDFRHLRTAIVESDRSELGIAVRHDHEVLPLEYCSLKGTSR